jgi:hypothetical protein
VSARLAILDGRWIGLVAIGAEKWDAEELPELIELDGAVEIVSAMAAMQAPQGTVLIRQCNLYPLAMTTGPKALPVKWSTVLWVDDLDAEEQKQIRRAYEQSTEEMKLNRARQRSGLVI